MTDFTDEDVTAVVAVLDESWDNYEDGARRILAAVLPAHDKRVRAEALRETAADMDGYINDEPVAGVVKEAVVWLRARADAEEGKPVCTCDYPGTHGTHWVGCQAYEDAEEGK